MSIPDPDPLSPEDWTLIMDALQDAIDAAQEELEEALPSSSTRRIWLRHKAQLEAVLGRVRETA